MDHTVIKFLHITGACLFVGNNLVTPLWKLLAERTRDAAVIAWSQRLVTITDFAFTGTGIVLLLGTGHAMLAAAPALAQQSWLREAYAGFIASGAIWVAVLVPVQIRQSRLARLFSRTGTIPPDYWRLARIWAAAGSVASLLPLASLFLMVTKR